MGRSTRRAARSRRSRSRRPRSSAHDYLWRVHKRDPRQGRDRRSSTARTTRRSSSSASTSSSRRRSGRRATTRSTTSSEMLDRATARRSSSSSCRSIATSSASGSRRATTTRRSAGSSALGDLEERKLWDDYQAAFEDALSKTLDGGGAVVRHPGEPQLVPEPGGRDDPGRHARRAQAGLPAGAATCRRTSSSSSASARLSGSSPPPKIVPKTPRMMSWPSRERDDPAAGPDGVVDRLLLAPRAASRCGLLLGLALALGRPLRPPPSPRAWRAISRCCWAGVIVFMPVAVVGSTPARIAASAAACARPRAPREPRGDPLVGALAVDRRAVLGLERAGRDPALELDGVDRRHQRVGRQQAGRGERRRHAARRQDRDQRLAGPERGDRLLDVVELGHRERPGGLAQRVGVVGRERPQRVLDAVAELGEDRRRARRSAPGSRSRRRRPSSGSAARSARPGPSAPRTRRRTAGAPRRRRSTASAWAGRPPRAGARTAGRASRA